MALESREKRIIALGAIIIPLMSVVISTYINALMQNSDVPISIKIYLGWGLLVIFMLFIDLLLVMWWNIPYELKQSYDGFQIKRSVKEYPCIIIYFETFESEYYDTFLRSNQNSLYHVTVQLCGLYKNNVLIEKTYKKQIKPTREHFNEFQKDLRGLCEKPKKVKKSELEECIRWFRGEIEDTSILFDHFKEHYKKDDELKPNAKDVIEKKYDEFYKKHILLEAKNPLIKSLLYRIGCSENFTIGKAKTINELLKDDENDKTSGN